MEKLTDVINRQRDEGREEREEKIKMAREFEVKKQQARQQYLVAKQSAKLAVIRAKQERKLQDIRTGDNPTRRFVKKAAPVVGRALASAGKTGLGLLGKLGRGLAEGAKRNAARSSKAPKRKTSNAGFGFGSPLGGRDGVNNNPFGGPSAFGWGQPKKGKRDKKREKQMMNVFGL